ncbi:MAG: chorismate synthase, partial [Desulfohalobiaceae bacterium]
MTSNNTLGRIFQLTSYGESHGPGIGGGVDGCPAGVPLTEEHIQSELDLRRPGSGPTSTPRSEADRIQLL